jgi:endonuclease/exonuclease/phosphatase family metal-dependent hydrolase
MYPRRLPDTSARCGSGPLPAALVLVLLGVLLVLTPQAAGAETDEPQTTAPTPSPEVIRTPIRVATYNVCSRRCPRLHSWGRRSEHLAAEVARARPDVVTIQEIGNRSTRRLLTDRLGRRGYVAAVGAAGQYTFYRSATVSDRDEAGSRLAHLEIRTPQHAGRHGHAPVQVFRHLGTGGRVVVVNYHLPAYDTSARDRARRDEYEDVERRLAPLRRALPGVPVVKSGDFNSYVQPNTSRYDSHRHRARVWHLLRGDGFVDAVRTAASTSRARLNTIIRVPGDRRRFGPSRHLDHVFVQRGTTVTRWTLVRRAGGYRQQSSDHRLTYADLVLTGG